MYDWLLRIVINNDALYLVRRTLWAQINHFFRRRFVFFLLTETSFLVDFLPSV